MNTNLEKDLLAQPWSHYLISFLDYLWVITIYVFFSITLAIIIDGYIIPPFDKDKEINDSFWVLGSKILMQLSIQGFIAIFLCGLLQKVYSPFNGILGYNDTSLLGILVRNPAIISVVLFALSASLRYRLVTLFNRYSRHPIVPY
jgi:hypothetical protein